MALHSYHRKGSRLRIPKGRTESYSLPAKTHLQDPIQFRYIKSFGNFIQINTSLLTINDSRRVQKVKGECQNLKFARTVVREVDCKKTNNHMCMLLGWKHVHFVVIHLSTVVNYFNQEIFISVHSI